MVLGRSGSSGRQAAARARPEARVRSGGRERASWSERRGAACACGAGRQRRQGRGTCSSGVVMALGRGAAGRQQGSEHGRARSSDAACAEKPGRGRERESEVRELTLNFLKIFNGSSKNFEHESCSKRRNLQLLFHPFSHLRFCLKVTNSNLNAKEITLYTLFFEFLSKFCVLT